MPKNIEDIIVPERKRSIRNIPIPEGRRRGDRDDASFAQKEYQSPTISHDDFDTPLEDTFSASPRFGKKSLWLAIGTALIVLIFAVLSVFDRATLSYIPRSQTLSFDKETFVAKKSGEDAELLFSIVKLSGDRGLEVPASGEENISRRASGTIVVYNDATAEPQRLVENTRFETPNGLIYRIPSAIVIPGKKTVSGISQPGVIETIVYADEAGDKYNVGLTDFTLPGLKGSARFSSIYARSKTAMAGGFVGLEKVIGAQDKVRATAELEMVLKDELYLAAKAQVPEDFVLLPSLSSVTFENLPQTNTGDEDSVKLNIQANLLGVMFKKSDLANHLALNKVTLVRSESVHIPDLSSLSFAFVDAIEPNLSLSEEIKFSVTGEARMLWHTDEIALKSDLIGKHKRDISSILKNYPTIVSATAKIRPFWKSSFPSDSMRIVIKKLPVK